MSDRLLTIRSRVLRGVGLIMAVLCAISLPPAAGAQSLERRIAGVVDGARLGSAVVGISVVDAASGAELVSVNAGAMLIPASNHKLLTSGAALLSLSPSYEFRTLFLLSGDRIIVRASGDPALGDPELLRSMGNTVAEFIDRLAGSMVDKGVLAASEIVIDDRVFDRDWVHSEWPANQLNRAYCAPVCGLNFHANLLNIFAGPAARKGDSPTLTLEPSAPWLSVDSRRVQTVNTGTTELWVEHGETPLQFILHGSVRGAIKEPVQVSVRDPSLVFGRLLADALVRRGVRASGAAGTLQVRLAGLDEELGVDAEGPTGVEARLLAVVRTPMEVVLERCNVDSDNLYAECLLKLSAHKVTGQPGSWSSGASVVRTRLRERLGPEFAASAVISDGCGLSRNNKVSAGTLARWLAMLAADTTVGPMFLGSLPVAKEEGTVKKRFANARLRNEVRCKSGYIREVRTLSGYVTDPASGRTLAFSILVNQIPSGMDQKAKDMHEAVVEKIDGWLTEQVGTGKPAAAATK